VTIAKHTTRLLALGACLVAAGCGSEEGAGIPSESAAALQGQLDSIQSRFESPGGVACADIAGGDDPNTTVVQENLEALPDDVDADVRDALTQSFDHLFELVEEQCQEAEQEPEPVPVEPAPETETAPPTTTTETVPPPTDTEPEPTTTTTPEPPPAEGGDGGTGEGGTGGGEGASGGAGGGAVVPEDTG
jgi:hypothetical protein